MPGDQKITLGEMRSDGGPRRLPVYCPHCAHNVVVGADAWGDDVRLSDLEPKFTCKACGHRGADIRPLFDGRRRAL
jgi:hypothetical protein